MEISLLFLLQLLLVLLICDTSILCIIFSGLYLIFYSYLYTRYKHLFIHEKICDTVIYLVCK